MPHMLFYAQTWCFSSRYFSLVVCLCRLCVWGYFKYNLWLQTGALVRCRYLNSAGFLSQTSDFPHTFPLRGLEKKKKRQRKMSKRQQSLDRKQRSGRTEALHCFKSTLSAHRQRRPRVVVEAPGPLPECLRPAEASALPARLRAVKTAPFVCAAEEKKTTYKENAE